MKDFKKVVALIPARGGSKGIPRKNLHLLAGKPLLAHSIEHASQSTMVGRIVVSTDDAEIGAVARQYGAEVIWRPDDLSGDMASSESALLHALDHLRDTEGYAPDLVVFLQATSPLRAPGSLDQAIEQLLTCEADSLVSVVPAHVFLWSQEDGLAQPLNYDPRNRPRRQDRPAEYIENGSIYVFRPWVLRELNSRLGGKIALFVMEPWSAIDIDTPADVELCEQIIASRPTKRK